MTVNVPDPEVIYYTTEELAKRFRTSLSTIRYWRMIGTGPTGVRFGRRVLYADHDVTAWERRREQQRERRRDVT